MECIFCNKDFEPTDPRAKLCSDKCKQDRKNEQGRLARQSRPKKKGNCFNCGKEIVLTRSDSKWCSNDCKMATYKLQKREANAKKHKKHKLTCECCKRKFVAHRDDQRFCSNDCKTEFHKTEWRKETAAKRAATKKICPICDKQFSPKKTMKQIYCSKKCCYLFQKKIYKALDTCLKQAKTKKSNTTHKLFGYTPKDLQEHIQAYPDWATLKDDTWHLDHIFPIIAFIKKGIKDFAIIKCPRQSSAIIWGKEL